MAPKPAPSRGRRRAAAGRHQFDPKPSTLDPYAVLNIPAKLARADDAESAARLMVSAMASALPAPLVAVVLSGRGGPKRSVFGQLNGADLESALRQAIHRFVVSSHGSRHRASAESVVEIDVRKDAPKLADHGGLGRLLVVDLGARGESFGSLIVGNNSRQPYAPEERAAAQTLAVLASMALERVGSEQAEQESRERIRAIVDTAVDAIITISERGVVETFNPAGERIFGYSADEVVGKNVSMLMTESDREQHNQYIERYLSTGEKKIIGMGREVTGRHKDGTDFPLELAVSEVRLGKRRLFTGIARDITERKRAEEALQENAKRFRRLARRLHVLNGLMRIAVSSLELGEVFDRIAEQVKQLVDHDRLSISLHPLDADHVETYVLAAKGPSADDKAGSRFPLGESPMGEAILTRRPIVRQKVPEDCVYPLELEMANQSGLHSTMYVPLESKGRVIGTLNFGSYHSDKYGEEELRLAREVADHLVVVVEHARLYEESQEVATFRERSRLAHEMHDALAQAFIDIILELDLAERTMNTDAAAARREVEQARQSANEGLEEVRRAILALRPPALEKSSLHEAIAREIETLAPEGVTVVSVGSGTPVPVPYRVETALFRIAREASMNIRRHAKATRVDALLDYGDDALTLTITDDGVGFDVRAVGADPASLELSGGGFGLASIHERARDVGGNVQVESAPGRGTRVITRIRYTSVAETHAEPRPETPPSSEETPEPIRVLLADDHAVARQGIRRMLEEAPDIKVVAEAADGAEALAKARTLRPDVMIADVRMPKLGGIEVVSELKAGGLEIPSIVLTAYLDGGLVSSAMKAGAQGYFLKDVVGTELIDAVRAVHRGETLLQPAAAGALAHRVQDGGQEGYVEILTPREVEVLDLLAKGQRNKEIARALGLTEATVKFHVTHIFEKLGVSGRTEALGKAIKLGIVSPP